MAASGMGSDTQGTGPAADPRAPYVRLAVVGLICRAGGGDDPRWLLLHRTRPFEAWDPPGGRMEAGRISSRR